MEPRPADLSERSLLEHRDFLRALSRGLLADDHAAEDVVQDTLLVALERPPARRDNVRGWLGRVAARLAFRSRRTAKRRASREAAAARTDDAPSALDAAARLEVHRRIVRAVRSLPEPYRSTVVFRYLYQLPIDEVAQSTGVPEGTVKARLARALRRLRADLDHASPGAWRRAVLPLAGAPSVGGAFGAPAAVESVLMGTTMKKVALLAGALVLGAAGVVTIVASHGRESEDPAGLSTVEVGSARASPEDPSSTDALRLEGREAEPERAPAPSGDARAGAPFAARRRQRWVRVVDARGRPIEKATVAVTVGTGPGTQPTTLFTDSDGRTLLDLSEGPLVAASVDVPAWRGSETVFARGDPAGLDPAVLETVVADDRLMLPVRTVDTRGAPRPGQRILFRPLPEGGVADGWRGESSDAEGWVRLGPFREGSRMQVRAGPRGERHPDPDDASDRGWRTVLVDGSVVEVVVGDEPKLRLRLAEVGGDDVVPIAVLEAETGRPVFPPERHAASSGDWTAPAIRPGLALDVFVGPLADGRYGRLRGISPREEPYVVELRPGIDLTGRVVSRASERPVAGPVWVVGSGFELRSDVDADGEFRFASVPDEPLTLHAQVEVAGRKVRGRVRRTHERHVEMTVGPPARVSGRVSLPAFDGAEGGARASIEIRTRGPLSFANDEWRLSSSAPDFALELVPGQWTLEASAVLPDGRVLRGERDLGQVTGNVDGAVIELRPE